MVQDKSDGLVVPNSAIRGSILEVRTTAEVN